MAEVVRAYTTLEAVNRRFWCFGLRRRRDARVQAEHVQRFRGELVGERADRRERREVADHGHAAAGLLCGLGGARAVAVRVVDRVAILDQPFGRVQTDALGGAGDGYVEGRSAGKKYRGEQGGDSG